jgi:Transposase zinc-binding domain/Putative transposase
MASSARALCNRVLPHGNARWPPGPLFPLWPRGHLVPFLPQSPCPKCQTYARDKWLGERSKELLPVSYVHVLFTLSHELSWLALNNKIVYDLLLRASAATLMKVAADPKHLGAEISFLSVLHTWGQTVIPSRGLSFDHQRWIHPRRPFFFPVKVLGRVFRGKFIAGLKRAFRRGGLVFPEGLKALGRGEGFRRLPPAALPSRLVV